jgi:hypothetical protein
MQRSLDDLSVVLDHAEGDSGTPPSPIAGLPRVAVSVVSEVSEIPLSSYGPVRVCALARTCAFCAKSKHRRKGKIGQKKIMDFH